MPSFGKLFKSKDTSKKTTTPVTNGHVTPKPQWVDSWLRTRVDPDEVAELLRGCTREMKSRALDVPFLLLPFRPSSDPSAARTFVRNYFIPPNGRSRLKGEKLLAELKITEVMVLISVMKWCWARLPGGVISWETYKMFKIGEKDSHFAKDAYSTFLPLSVDTPARAQIINDFFELLAALAAHGKTNGFGGYKLSRYAGWWAFEHYDTGKGFEAGYKSWDSAADATSHMFFAYLRSLSPAPGQTTGILDLPRSLQQLLAATSYPPPTGLLSNDTTKLVMIVDVVSPTPYALLRRAKNFEYRDDDQALQEFAEQDDPVNVLTDECRRVLRAISTTNQSHVSDAKTSTSLTDPSWSRFEDIGFTSALDEIGEHESTDVFSRPSNSHSGMNNASTISQSPVLNLNRPTTPSWADFLSSGFPDENGKNVAAPMLPPDKILPPILPQSRGQSSQSHRRNLDAPSILEPAELASIIKINIDDAFWWVWVSSLAGEEPTSRKAVFGRCAYIETKLAGGHWMIMEEQVKGAAPEPVQGAYIVEKKGFLGFTTKGGRLTRRRSGLKRSHLSPENHSKTDLPSSSRVTLAPDQQAKIRSAALELSKKKQAEESVKEARGRRGENDAIKTTSVYTLGPFMKDEASPALQWAKQYDKNAIRTQYLGNGLAGRGSSEQLNGLSVKKSTSSLAPSKERDLPPVPSDSPEKSVSAATDPPAVPDKTAHDLVTMAQPAVPPTQSFVPPTEKTIEPEQLIHPSVTPATEAIEALPVISEQKPASPPVFDRRTSSPESKRSQPPPTGRQNGIKRLFGTMRKQKEESERKPPLSPVDANPAVAAARRALEGKASPNQTTDSPPLSPNHFNQFSSVKDRVAAFSQTSPEVKPQPAAPIEKQQPASPVQKPQPILPVEKRAPTPELKPEPKVPLQAPKQEISEPAPPRTRRDEEFDKLSRVDTHEREHADQEFSRFDQGPLSDQPAFVPDESPTKENFEDASSYHPKHQSIYSSVTMDTEITDENSQPEVVKQISPNDRWAQIRRNAAERAARTSEDHGNRSRTETRTDDGETSGEETIESRVARIKARVAELTGNMEQTRR